MRRSETIKRMMRFMKPVRLIGLLGLVSLMGGCSSDDVEETPGQQTLTLMPISSSFLEVEPIGGTRTGGSLPTGYVPFDELYSIAPLNTNIGVWMTPSNTTTLEDFIYKSGHDWNSTVKLPASGTHYIYGYMPHLSTDNVSITSLNGTGDNYANGAVITLADYPTVTGDDICAIVGLRKGTTSSERITSLTTDVKCGNFTYAVETGTHNNIFILLKHLYAGLRFSARLDAEYFKVRDIYVTKVELIGLNMYEKGDLKVTLTANTTGADPSSIVFDTSGEAIVTESEPAILYQKDLSDYTDNGYPLGTDEPTKFIGCFAFGGKCTKFKLRTTYDVYDKEGNRTRQGCIADNEIDLLKKFYIQNPSTIVPGNIYTINLLVEPSYLYVLSEPDLDNPTVEMVE